MMSGVLKILESRLSRPVPSVLCLAMTALLLTGCASNNTRIEQFSNFAKAGIAYQEAFDGLLDLSLDNKVLADNRVLILNRSLSSDPSARKEALSKTDEEFRTRQAIITEIKKQGRHLKNYFLGLALLADNGEGSEANELSTGIISSTTTLANVLSDNNEKIAELRFGTKNIEEAAGVLTPLAIAHFKSKTLNTTLAKTALTVQQALRIHKKALQSLETQMTENEALGHEQLRTETIFKPYVKTGALPENWGVMRGDWFKQQSRIEQLGQASEAATQLELAFTALVEKKSPGASFDLLLADISQLLDLVESFEDKTEPANTTDASANEE